MVFSLTKHRATLLKAVCAVNSQCCHFLGGLDRAGWRLGRESTERLAALARHGVPSGGGTGWKRECAGAPDPVLRNLLAGEKP